MSGIPAFSDEPWNGEAQRWDKGQAVPGAVGGEKLQALVLDNLWPAESGGSSGNATTGNTAGIVLAYRVGEGSSAEIVASLGQWGSDGQLGWSAPVQLTDDQVEDQAFSMMEGKAGLIQSISRSWLLAGALPSPAAP